MDRDETFESWAPNDGIWTPWAKAILFAYVDVVQPSIPEAPTWVREELFLTPATGYRDSARVALPAIVVDLPGVDGVAPMFPVVRALLGGAAQLRDRGLPASAPPAFLPGRAARRRQRLGPRRLVRQSVVRVRQRFCVGSAPALRGRGSRRPRPGGS
jgi:hypothetical protein